MTPSDAAERPASDRLREVLRVLLPVLDVVHQPVSEAAVPAWCERRGWAEFLLQLSDSALFACEGAGLVSEQAALEGVPTDLRELLFAVRRCTRLARLARSELSLPPDALRGVPARKREQLAVLLGTVAPLARRAGRLVDVGAGDGHLSRLAAELLGREALAVERDPRRLERGGERREQRQRQVGALPIDFRQMDVGDERDLALAPSDLAVGLHACGELGDRLTLAAAEARCDLALVSCCLQKRRGAERSAVSVAGAGLVLSRAALGLTNLTLQPDGVEASLVENLRAREARLALRQLLASRGLLLEAGEEMRGINRRRAQAGFSELARLACALRQMSPATPAELEFHAGNAQRDYARMRRLSLPRHALSRLVELAVVFDRAAAIEERGQAVCVAQLFEQRMSPRNTVLLATRRREHLPKLAAFECATLNG